MDEEIFNIKRIQYIEDIIYLTSDLSEDKKFNNELHITFTTIETDQSLHWSVLIRKLVVKD